MSERVVGIHVEDGHPDRYKPLPNGTYSIVGSPSFFFQVTDWHGMFDFKGTPFDGTACVLKIRDLRIGPTIVTPALVKSVRGVLHSRYNEGYECAQMNVREALGLE